MTTAHPVSPAPSALTVRGAPYADVRETHSGVVFLVGDRAYKLKKPVDLGFLDFSTRELRLRACQREVRLNRQFAPDVYLGVADIIGPDGDPEDHMVVMRRMPDHLRLSTLVRRGTGVDEPLRAVARNMAAFHATALRNAEISRDGGRDALRDRWCDSFTEIRPFIGEVLPATTAEAIERLTLAYLNGRADLFAERVTSGAIVDGHGDLLADDIFCLADGPRILDCLEFDDALRHLDKVDDVACLAMDLEHIGNPLLAARFLAWYVEFSNENVPTSLTHHYLAYRAFVRTKVSCLRHAQGALGAAGEARWLANITERHLEQAAVKLVLVGGAPGTGKSTLAGGLADRLGMSVLSSDRIRKELAGISPTVSAAAPLEEGIYGPDHTQHTYEELEHRATKLLRMGESVVIDATWSDPRQRQLAEKLADTCVADLVQLRCELPIAEATSRIALRHNDMSDADSTIAETLSLTFADWPAASTIDTTEPTEVCLQRSAQIVRPSVGIAAATARPMMVPD